MTITYDHLTIDARWQAYWLEHRTFRAEDFSPKPKYYVLDMFPYPSGAGLHVGHPEGYTATDIVCRFKRMRGFNVLHPMGWDAFGLPAENYAIKTGTHPAVTTAANVDNFRRQIRSLGFSYDWDREINTTDPGYYRWTQWIFLKLFEKGLAYQHEAPINWCTSCKTGLANEEVKDGVCDRCGSAVEKRPIRQWMLRITAYAERLLADLEQLDWPEGIKQMQRDWIGRSEGADVDFTLPSGEKLRIYTTRPDTLFGATYMVLSPEHAAVPGLTTEGQRAAVEAYCQEARRKSDLERTDLAKDKTGVFTGSYAVNPVNDERIPIWVADYVLASYGHGAIMAVPGHDERDWAFATKFGLPILEVVSGGDVTKEAYVGDGQLVSSGLITGLSVPDAIARITAWLAERGVGQRAVNYKLRDWVFSRQRYWGEPFPLLHLEDGQVVPLPEDALPLRLPDLERIEPTGTGESPLTKATAWVQTTDPRTGAPARRETNTMPQWAGSCWYYLRFIDPHNDHAFVDPAKERYWMPVDLYVGGAEHAVLHLLYARFWHKVLFDLGQLSTDEPFQRLVNQGLILGEDREKMSKSRGNVVNPDEIIAQHGADAFRCYEMFMGPLEVVKPWSTRDVVGVRRWLERSWRLLVEEDGTLSSAVQAAVADEATTRLLHRTIKAVTQDLETLRFNTAIARLMELVNGLTALPVKPRAVLETYVLLLAPFAPHVAEELWQRLGHDASLAHEPWPAFDEALAAVSEMELVIQVNGKVRDRLMVPTAIDRDEAIRLGKTTERMAALLQGKTLVKEIFVPARPGKTPLLNLVVKD
jgi:leucyl-tRNA synthetase